MKLVALTLGVAALLAAQQQTPGPEAEGRALFRSNCAFCHGATGEGGRGPNLHGNLVHGNTADDIKSVIHNGIPGTQMPAYTGMETDELNVLAQYVLAFSSAGGKVAAVHGDAAAGQRLYTTSSCANCHQIGAEGSVFGPDLSRIGAARSLAYLRESIVHPSADVPAEYTGVSVVNKAGRKFTGIRLNEDTFSIQLRTPDQQFRLFQKDDLQQITPVKQSLMPAYEKLSAADLNNLLAYLETLRGPAALSTQVDKVQGIK